MTPASWAAKIGQWQTWLADDPDAKAGHRATARWLSSYVPPQVPTPVPVPVPEDQAQIDAAFLRSVVRDNEHWNAAGIAEDDLSVVFEMSACCAWGSTHTTARFRRALRELSKASGVVERARRWYVATSTTLDTIDEHGARICARRGCVRDISHLRTDATFCSPGCRNRASRRDRPRDYPLQQSRSERRETPENRGAGISGPPRPIAVSRGRTAGHRKKGT